MRGQSANKTKSFFSRGRIALPAKMWPVLIPWPAKVSERDGKKDPHRDGEMALGRQGFTNLAFRQLNPTDLILFLRNRKAFNRRYRKALEMTAPIEEGIEAELRSTIALGSPRRLRKAFGGGRIPSWIPRKFKPTWTALDFLGEHFNSRIGQAHPILWRPDRAGMAVGLFCENITTALYLLALELYGRLGGIILCRHCHGAFVPTRKDKRFCKPSHRAAYHVAKAQARARKRNRARGKPKPTTTSAIAKKVA
jgi:hypothetical protein